METKTVKLRFFCIALVAVFALIGAIGASAAEIDSSGYGLLWWTQYAASGSTATFHYKTASSVPFTSPPFTTSGNFPTYMDFGFKSSVALNTSYTYTFFYTLTCSTSNNITSNLNNCKVYLSANSPDVIGERILEIGHSSENPIISSGLGTLGECSATVQNVGSATGNGPLSWQYDFVPPVNASAGTWIYFDCIAYPVAATSSQQSTFTVQLAKLTNNQTGEEITGEALEDLVNGITELNEKVDNLPGDTAQAIHDLEEEENSESLSYWNGESGNAQAEIEENDPTQSINLVQLFQRFWNSISSTDTTDTIVLPQGKWKSYTFWTEKTIDLSTWLDNSLVQNIILVGKLLMSIGLIKWILTFYYQLINAVLNPNSDKSVMDVILHRSPL